MITQKLCVTLCTNLIHRTMAVNFYIDNRTDKKGDASIRVSIIIKGVRYLTSTGYKIAPAKWMADKQQVRKGSNNAAGMTWVVINSALARISNHFMTYENECLLNNVSPDMEMLKLEYARVFGRRHATAASMSVAKDKNSLDLWDYYQLFIDERSATNQWTSATHQKFKALKSHLDGWNQNLSFGDFTDTGFSSFISYLRDVKQMKNSTIGKQIGFIKWFLRWATLKGYNTNTAFQSFTPKLKTAPKQVVFLEWNELMKVLNYEIPEDGTVVTLCDASGKEYTKTVHASNSLRITRDIFCFCCFTSLRFSDAANLKRSNIIGGSLTITTIKTADTITIELNKYALSILERYADADFNGFALPHITNQRMNMYIKDLCELCEINRPITHTYYRGAERIEETMPKYELIGTHTGRRTFICNALMLGIPAEIVMKWTGHADYKSMKPYIDVTNDAKAKAMKRFNDL